MVDILRDACQNQALRFPLIFKSRNVLRKLHWTRINFNVLFLNSITYRTKMVPLDPDSPIMKGRGFLESGMTLMSNILLKVMWLGEQCKVNRAVFVENLRSLGGLMGRCYN